MPRLPMVMTRMKKKVEISLRQRALNYLSRREYARSELLHKLSSYTEDQSEIEALLDELAGKGWLSEQRFTDQLIHAKRGKYGSRMVAHELQEHGISEEVVDHARSELKTQDYSNAAEVWRKKFGELPKDTKEKAKQIRFLQSRGFDLGIILQVLKHNGATIDDDNV